MVRLSGAGIMTTAQIITEYTALERAAREMIPGKFLMPEDVLTCIDVCARRLGITVEAVKDAVRSVNAGGWG